jgi:hypothetical protein
MYEMGIISYWETFILSHDENISEYGGFPIACYTHPIHSFSPQIIIYDGILLCNHYRHKPVTFLNSSETSIV